MKMKNKNPYMRTYVMCMKHQVAVDLPSILSFPYTYMLRYGSCDSSIYVFCLSDNRAELPTALKLIWYGILKA